MPINRKGRCKGTGAQGHEEFTGGQRSVCLVDWQTWGEWEAGTEGD